VSKRRTNRKGADNAGTAPVRINSPDISKVVAPEVDNITKLSLTYQQMARLILRDLNNNNNRNPVFSIYSKDDIVKFLANPYTNAKNLRKAVEYIYVASMHFRRLIDYFVGLTDLAYIVSPYKIDPKKANDRIVGINYRRVLDTLTSMSIKTQFGKIIKVCLKDDIFYGTLWITKDVITVQQLPSDYCEISSIEGNVFNVQFNFSYFDTYPQYLDYYPEEFKKRYNDYKNKLSPKWQELSCPNTFAIKCNYEIPEYPIPPFAGLLREIYDLEDYRNLKLAKTELENYALLAMKLPMDDEGNWQIDYDKAVDFWRNLSGVVPEEVGTVLTPMDIDKISFERSGAQDPDTIAEAENALFGAAGVSSLLFNNPKASANALLLSIKVDQALTYSIVKSIEDMVNRFIQYQSYGKNFKVTFLNTSDFNRKEVADQYLKACQYGMPFISAYCATVGLGQAEMDGMSYLETDILELPKMFEPLIASSQMSSSDITDGSSEEGGRPEMEIGERSDSGEQSHIDSVEEGNW
jgi:hypothetical protein